MSVQLIVYPQSYGGYFNTISSSPTEVVVNGISFINLGATSEYTSSSATPYVDTITNAPPNSINTWYSYRSDFVGTPAFPTVLAGNLVLNSLGNGSTEPTGIYQKLTNLIIGQQYKLTINIGTQAANGSITNRFFDGLTPQGSVSIFGTATSSITQNFFATNTEMTVMLGYYSTVAEDLTISDISVQPIIGAIPSGSSSILEDGQVICDLYENEDLPLTLSVDDFKNVAEQVQSYSKAFNLPATKRNNKIFNQIFEITRSYDGVIFNPYKKTKCVLKQDGFVLFQGYLRLLDVTDKLGEVSFNVNLYSEVIALADFLKDRTFSDLDFTELTHDYDYSSIRDSWVNNNIFTNPSTSGFRSTNTVKYPFVDWNHQFTVGGSGNPVLPNLESAFRPFISIKYLIDRIFQGTPFSYTSEFFNTSFAGGGAFDFHKLYMDFNWGADNTPSLTDVTIYTAGLNPFIAFPLASTVYTALELKTYLIAGFPIGSLPPNYNTTTNIITSTVINEQYDINYSYAIRNTSASPVQLECRWLYNSTIEINYTGVQTIAAGATFIYQGNFIQILATAGETLGAEFKASSALVMEQYNAANGFGNLYSTIFNFNILNITSSTLLQTLRGELGQWDFLKGLMTMFNLITIPDENNPNNIIIEPYADVFIDNTKGTDLLSRSIQHDWTEKVDVSQMKLEPLADLNKNTIFKFVEDEDDYAFTQYKNSIGGHLYGSKKYNAGNEFNILDGEDEIIAEPFAATVVKPLMSQYPDLIVPAVYSYSANDDTSEGFENSPRIMYNNGVKTLTSCTYFVPCQNQTAPCGNATEDEFLQFSHLTDIPTIVTAPPNVTDTRDFHFGECQLLNGVGNPTAYNLFNMYWLPYYAELYNPDTRIMTIKVNLSPSDINTFKFNDTVFIKNRIFRCNRIDYKPNDLATVEFILIP